MTARQLDPANRAPLLHWMIFTGLSLFALVLLWRFGLIRQMVVADRTYISSFIVLFYVGTTLHCLWRMIAVSREGEAARAAARLIGRGGHGVGVVGEVAEIEGAGTLPKGLIAAHFRDLAMQVQRQGARRLDPTLLLRGLAVRLRGSNQFGAFASDTLMKLGLVGTGDRGAIKSSMNLMSDGMAVAMYTTLVGLVGSILVRIQYYLLEGATATLFAVAVGLVEVYLVSLPGQPTDRQE
jgi:biopolymer transport protein ExbB/TolQ